MHLAIYRNVGKLLMWCLFINLVLAILPITSCPISLTCVVSKVLESIIRDSMLHHLTVNGLISQQQHGFLPHRSCTSQLLTALNDWTCSLDQGYPIDVIYFDFRKAFDTVLHARLLLKLKEYGINGNLLCWLHGFLSNRRQRVSINGSFS